MAISEYARHSHRVGRRAVSGVRTERGDIEAETVVIAGGMFAAELGGSPACIPVRPMSHEYIVTQPFRERDPARPLPTLRDRTCSSTSARTAAGS